MEKIYIAPIVKQISRLYGDLLFDYKLSTRDRLMEMANVSFKSIQAKNEIACVEYSNYHPNLLGKNQVEIFNKVQSVEDAEIMIAHQFGFQSREALAKLGDKKSNLHFEKAVDALLSGDLIMLKELLDQHPSLIKEKSDYGHQATLLHYCGSNGVEFYRQRVPMNLPEIAKLLLQNGADIEATMKVYGGNYNTYALLTSSAHPKDAGIMEEMKNIF